MNTSDLARLFSGRTHSAPLRFRTEDVVRGSRVGGRAPAHWAATPPRCARCGGQVTYLFTLDDDVLGAVLGEARSVSAFCCRDVECRLHSKDVTGSSPLLVPSHHSSERSATKTAIDPRLDGRGLALRPPRVDTARDGHPQSGTKVGGHPGLVQRERAILDALRARGYAFLFQFDEGSVPLDAHYAEFLLFYGALYVFARFEGTRVADDFGAFAQWA